MAMIGNDEATEQHNRNKLAQLDSALNNERESNEDTGRFNEDTHKSKKS